MKSGFAGLPGPRQLGSPYEGLRRCHVKSTRTGRLSGERGEPRSQLRIVFCLELGQQAVANTISGPRQIGVRVVNAVGLVNRFEKIEHLAPSTS